MDMAPLSNTSITRILYVYRIMYGNNNGVYFKR